MSRKLLKNYRKRGMPVEALIDYEGIEVAPQVSAEIDYEGITAAPSQLPTDVAEGYTIPDFGSAYMPFSDEVKIIDDRGTLPEMVLNEEEIEWRRKAIQKMIAEGTLPPGDYNPAISLQQEVYPAVRERYKNLDFFEKFQ